MAVQILEDGPRNAVIKVTAATTIDVSTLFGSPARVKILEIIYDVGTLTDSVLSWDATVDEPIVTLSGRETMCFREFGGLWNNAGAGITGDIVVAGTGAFTVILGLRKH